ncbi:MAG: hypothetical protein VX776_10870, partial [Planctomycetota bacterium]|nr:hypothetical protein [Planctomycetota bacterium]
IWPPQNALERFLTLVLPLALAIEVIVNLASLPNWITWLARSALAAAIPRILLQGSVYLSDSAASWPFWQAAIVMGSCSFLLLGTWSALSGVSSRSSTISVSLGLQMAILAAGLAIMMTGYLKGGSLSLPFTGALTATSVTAWLLNRHHPLLVDFGKSTTIGVSVVGLASLLMIGRFFGELSTIQSLVIFLSPLLCWLTEIQGLQRRHPGFATVIRLTLVAIPLLLILFLAKRNFDRDLGPLLSTPSRSQTLWLAETLINEARSQPLLA